MLFEDDFISRFDLNFLRLTCRYLRIQNGSYMGVIMSFKAENSYLCG